MQNTTTDNFYILVGVSAIPKPRYMCMSTFNYILNDAVIIVHIEHMINTF